jgi:hypothetical protein
VNSRVAESLEGSAPRSAEGLGVHLRQLLGLEIELALAEAVAAPRGGRRGDAVGVLRDDLVVDVVSEAAPAAA